MEARPLYLPAYWPDFNPIRGWPHSTETVAEVLALTCLEPPGEVTH